MATTHTLRGDIHSAANWSIALSVLMMFTGLLALAVPAMTGLAATLVFGWLLVFSGALHLGYAWRASGAKAILWEIVIAVVYGAIGIYLLGRPVLGLAALTFALATYLVFEGILEFVLAFVLRPLPGTGWLLVDGIVTLLLAALIAAGWPASSTWALGTIVAISMLFSGVTRLMLSTTVRKITA